MGATIEYQGYRIESTPKPVPAWEKWQLQISVIVNSYNAVKTREFCSNVLYATEHEADVHGIAFGKRLVDGKVNGLSISDLTPEDRRATPRVPVEFPSSFLIAKTLEGRGAILDLSCRGCRLESPVLVAPDIPLTLRIEIPDLVCPLRVETARVQWVTGQLSGIRFSRIPDHEHQRLGQLIDALQGSQASQRIKRYTGSKRD